MNRNTLFLLMTLLLIFFSGKVPEVQAKFPSARGRVIGDLGRPIEGVKVKCDEVSDLEAWTDQNGDFALHFHEEDIGKQVRIWASKQGYIAGFIVIVVSNESDYLPPIELKRLFIEGNILDSTTGEPIAEARIRVADQPSMEDTSDLAGHFIIISDSLVWHAPPGIRIRIDTDNRSYVVRVLMAFPWNFIRL